MNATAQDVINMSDREALYTVAYKLKHDLATEEIKDVTELERFNSVQRIFLVLDAYEQLTDKGGIGAFLTSEKRFYAPLVSFALKAIGDDSHRELFEDYLTSYKIDRTDLSDFDINNLEEQERFSAYLKLDSKYKFNDFDERYQNLPPIENIMVEFIKEHAEDLFRY